MSATLPTERTVRFGKFRSDPTTEDEWRSEEEYLARPVSCLVIAAEMACVVCGRPSDFDTCPRCDDDIERDDERAGA